MKLAKVAALLLPLVLATPAQADERLVRHLYSDNEVVRIDGRAGVQATIAFGQNESIENVAVGDSSTWQITPNKRADLLFVKPLEGSARTNMTVVTNRHTYFFDLVASPKSRPLYMLKFTYKDAPAPAAAPVAVAALDPAEAALAKGAVPVDPAAINYAWKKTGAAKLMPARVYDDGDAVYLTWAAKAEVPAILIQNEKGEEGPVNYTVQGDTIILPDVPAKIILRSGKASALLENARPASAPASASAKPGATVAAATPSTAKGN